MRTRATSNVLATMRSACVDTSPARTSSTICSTVNPCADRFGGAFDAAAVQQFERADVVGLEAVSAMAAVIARRRHPLILQRLKRIG